ncbi:MAG: 30S ribosomal protein S8 [archaeon]
MANTLADLLSSVKNAVKVGKLEMFARPTSGISTEVLKIMQSRGYIQEFEMIDDGRGRVYRIKLLHTINSCGAISPRTPIGVADLEKWEKRYLPAQGFGLLLITTSAGVLTHEEAKKKGLGGKLVAFVY